MTHRTVPTIHVKTYHDPGGKSYARNPSEWAIMSADVSKESVHPDDLKFIQRVVKWTSSPFSQVGQSNKIPTSRDITDLRAGMALRAFQRNTSIKSALPSLPIIFHEPCPDMTAARTHKLGRVSWGGIRVHGLGPSTKEEVEISRLFGVVRNERGDWIGEEHLTELKTVGSGTGPSTATSTSVTVKPKNVLPWLDDVPDVFEEEEFSTNDGDYS